MKDIGKTEIRMYGLGTGDCFVLKILSRDKKEEFTMMVDGGAWQGNKSRMRKAVQDIKKYVHNNLDVLVITHEHLDHVNLFDVAEDLFRDPDFKLGEIWMAWTEDERDELAREWKELFGQKKKALALASQKVMGILNDRKFRSGIRKEYNQRGIFNSFDVFSSSLHEFEELHYHSVNGDYKGDLKGMEVIKSLDTSSGTRYFEPGDIESVGALPGVRFYFLGPPRSIKQVKKEKGSKVGEAYDHNKVLSKSDSFSVAVSADDTLAKNNAPFEWEYLDHVGKAPVQYSKSSLTWRRIDHDWLMAGAGSLALRLNSGLNNLSLVFAIEFEKTKDVLLFTGDAEIGSWESWHSIEWEDGGDEGKIFTKDLLNRTVFYKVAHHLSHNGTAKEKGLKMMKSKKLVSMASLDYDAISSRWKSTMPNRAILKDLLSQCRGRLIVMNDNNLFLDFNEDDPLQQKIEDAKTRLSTRELEEFDENFKADPLFKQYNIKVS